MTAEEAVAQAEAEGLTLLKADNYNTGYKRVHCNSNCKTKPYQAQVHRGGKNVHLGYFATAEEAALCIARTPEGRAAASAAAAAQPPMTAEEAVRQAEAEGTAEGLTMLQSSINKGYKGVYFSPTSVYKPYRVEVRRCGKTVFLGYFGTHEEAALCYARSPEGLAAVAAAAAKQPPLTAEEAMRQAEAEGLMLLRADSSSGFKGVSFDRHCKSKPYKAHVYVVVSGKSKPHQTQLRRGGKKVSLGYFTTAEEAALCYARAGATHAASSRKRKAEPEEELEDAEEDDVEVVVLDAYEVSYSSSR